MRLWTIKLNVNGNVVIGEFVVGLKEIAAKVRVENLYTVAKGVDFTKFKVVIDFLGKLGVEFFELILWG